MTDSVAPTSHFFCHDLKFCTLDSNSRDQNISIYSMWVNLIEIVIFPNDEAAASNNIAGERPQL